MRTRTFHFSATAGALTGAALLAALTGCVADGSYQSRGYSSRPAVRMQADVVFEDDYDYYPSYETYYSRSRHEFVYRDGGRWVRRTEPNGVSLTLLLAAPSVRMDFRDAPERHHNTVVRTYPRNWSPAGAGHDAKRQRQDARHNERKDDRKNDRRDGHANDDRQH